LAGEGHAVRITTRSERGRAAIEAVGAECWVGTPDRLATLRGALENVTILCWMLATARATATATGPGPGPGTGTGLGPGLDALHGSRLEFFMTQAIDTTVRGVLYETGCPSATAPGAAGAAGAIAPATAAMLAGGEEIVRALGERNAIPVAFLTADPHDRATWLAEAHAAIASLLSRA
jgi:hypothetical protein